MATEKAPEAPGALGHLSVFLATCCYSSLIPRALVRRLPTGRLDTSKWSGCGLTGSLCGVLTYLALPLPWARSLWLLAGGMLAAVAVSHRAEQVLGRHDDQRIVIDEWIGAWMAATAVPHAWGWPLAAAFVLFRVFDVIKGPLGLLQRLPGGWGVVMDDVAAGLVAALVLHFIPGLS